MKKFYLFALFSFAFCEITNAQQPLSFTETVQVDSTSKKQLFNKAKRWFADTYKNSKEVLQIEDSATGEILGKAIFLYYSQNYISYTINILVRDGKYKCDIYDFILPNSALVSGLLSTETSYPRMPFTINKKAYNKAWEEAKMLSELEAKSLMNNLKNAMKKPTEDW